MDFELEVCIVSFSLTLSLSLYCMSQLGKEKFQKSHHCDTINGVPMLVGSEKPGIGGELLNGQKSKAKFSVYPRGQSSDLPAWVAFDKQVPCLKMNLRLRNVKVEPHLCGAVCYCRLCVLKHTSRKQ